MVLLERSSSMHLRTREQTWRSRQRQGHLGQQSFSANTWVACLCRNNGLYSIGLLQMGTLTLPERLWHTRVSTSTWCTARCAERGKLQPANINVCSFSLQDGTRPLHWAAFRGSVGVANLLVADRRVDINAHDLKRGLTPLHWTALPDLAGIANKAGKAHVASMLLADPRIDVSRRDKVRHAADAILRLAYSICFLIIPQQSGNTALTVATLVKNHDVRAALEGSARV